MLFSYKDVRDFHLKFEVPMPSVPTLLNDEAYNFRLGFLQEERDEYIDSVQSGDFATAIDSLLDEVYVAVGTSLMMGVNPDQWEDIFMDSTFNQKIMWDIDWMTGHPLEGPRFLSDELYNKAVKLLQINLNSFVHNHYYGNIEGCTESMSQQVLLCHNIARHMGIGYAAWKELWNDVQRANLSKVRATSAEQSKRNSTLDVVKPVGWIPPDGEALITKFYGQNWKDHLHKHPYAEMTG